MALPPNLPIQERQRLEKAGIRTLKEIGITKKLLRAGFSEARALELADQYGPQFNVYGSRGPGLLYTDKNYQTAQQFQLDKANASTQLASIKQDALGGKQIGTFIDAKTGQAYSGFQKSPFDLAVDISRRQQSLSQREYNRSVQRQKSSYLTYVPPYQRELREVSNNKVTTFVKKNFGKLQPKDQNLIKNVISSPKTLVSNTVQFTDYITPKIVKEYGKQGVRKLERAVGFTGQDVRNLARRYEQDIQSSKNKIQQSVRDKDLVRLQELQRKKSLTPKERLEKQRLEKIVSANYRRVAEIIAKTIAISTINLGVGTKDLILALARNPLTTLNSLPPAIFQQIKRDFNRLTGGNLLDVLELATEYYTFGKLSNIASKTAGSSVRALSKLRPSYVKYAEGKFVLRNAPKERFKVRGKERLLQSRVQSPSFKRPFTSVRDFLSGRKAGQFRKFTKDPGLILKEQTVESGAMPLSKQARLAGKTVTAVNASANQLTSWLKRKQIIRKPIPGENKFPVKIRNLLRKFDTGRRLTPKEFAGINKWLQRNVAPNTTLLERSLYLDPASGLRTSRLGIQPERTAGIRDILRGNFKLFGSNKPQVLIFENAKIAKFPKSLKDIERKLKQGKKLNAAETNRLIRWQVQTGSGKFKPIGSTIYQGGRELEVTLAPGEFVKRIEQVGFTYIKGKKVTFVTAEIFKPSKAILKQIKLANLGKLNSRKLASLESFLSRKLGRRIRVDTPKTRAKSLRETKRLARREDPNIPVLRVNGKFLRNIATRGFLGRGKLLSRSFIRKSVNRKRTTKINRLNRLLGTRFSPRGLPTRVRSLRALPPGIRRPSIRPTKRLAFGVRPLRALPPGIRPPRIRLEQKFTTRNLSKSIPVYYVVMKQKKKLVKLNPQPFTLNDAKDFLAYKLDNGFSRTAFFVPIGKRKSVVGLPKPIEGYFSKVRNKLRPFRIRYGKRRQLLNGYIEKRRFAFDKAGERSRKISRGLVRRQRPQRRLNPMQRRILIARLKKARAVRMRNLRRRR